MIEYFSKGVPGFIASAIYGALDRNPSALSRVKAILAEFIPPDEPPTIGIPQAPARVEVTPPAALAALEPAQIAAMYDICRAAQTSAESCLAAIAQVEGEEWFKKAAEGTTAEALGFAPIEWGSLPAILRALADTAKKGAEPHEKAMAFRTARPEPPPAESGPWLVVAFAADGVKAYRWNTPMGGESWTWNLDKAIRYESKYLAEMALKPIDVALAGFERARVEQAPEAPRATYVTNKVSPEKAAEAARAIAESKS